MGLNVGTLTAFLSLNNSSFLQGLAQSNRAMETLRVATVAATTATAATTAAQATAGAAAARLTAAQASQATATSLAANAQRELAVLQATGTATSGALSQAQARLAAANASLATADARLAAAQAASTSASAGLTAAQTAQAAAAANVTAAQAGVAAANTRTTASTQQTAAATSTLTATLGKLAVALVGVNLGMKALTFAKDSVVGFNSTLEQTRIAFTTMLGSAQKADAFIAEMKAFARTTPFEFSGLVTASQRLIAMGIAAKDIKPYLTAIGDAVAGLGGGRAEVDRFVLALGQMSAAGKVNAQDLRQMTELGVPATRILAEAYGLTVAQMRKMIETGNVMSADAIPRLIAGIENGTSATAAFGGMMAKQSQTWRGALSNIGDSLQSTLADIGLPLFQQMSKGAQGLAADLASPGFKQFAATMSDGIAYAVGVAVDVSGDLASIFADILSTIQPLTPALQLAAGGFVAVGEGVRWITGLLAGHGAEVAAVVVAIGGAVLAYQGMQLAATGAAIAIRLVNSAGAGISGLVSGMTLAKGAAAGLAVVLAAGLYWWQKQKQAAQEAKDAIDAYTSAVDQDAGVIGEATKAQLRDNLAKEGAYALAKKFGIAQITVTLAAEGQADAMKAVTAATKDQGIFGEQLLTTINKQRDAIKGQIIQYDDKKAALDADTSSTGDNSDATDANTAAVDDNRTAQQKVADALGISSGEMKTQADLSDVLRAALDRLAGSAMDMAAAQDAVAQAVIDFDPWMQKQIEKYGEAAFALDGNTQAALDNRKMLRERLTTINDEAEAIAKQTGNQDLATQALYSGREALIAQMTQAGFSQEAIKTLVDQMGNIHDIEAAITIATGSASQAIADFVASYNGVSITIPIKTEQQRGELQNAFDMNSPDSINGGARASGGPVRAGMLYKANELGHEYFQPAMDGRILSASETKAALSAKGNGSSADVVAALDRQTQALTAQSAALAQYQARAYVDAADRSRLAAAAGSSSVNR